MSQDRYLVKGFFVFLEALMSHHPTSGHQCTSATQQLNSHSNQSHVLILWLNTNLKRYFYPVSMSHVLS